MPWAKLLDPTVSTRRVPGGEPTGLPYIGREHTLGESLGEVPLGRSHPASEFQNDGCWVGAFPADNVEDTPFGTEKWPFWLGPQPQLSSCRVGSECPGAKVPHQEMSIIVADLMKSQWAGQELLQHR